MALAEVEIGVPVGGLNITDAPRDIGEDQAQSIRNMRVVGSSLESFRGGRSVTGVIPFTVGAAPETDSILVFRTKAGNIEYMFAHGGRVYSAPNLYQPAVSIGYNGDVTARIKLIQYHDSVYILNGVDQNQRYDGTNVWFMGIDPPGVVPTLQSIAGTREIDYYYTWYNSTNDVESNPSPIGSVECDDDPTIRVRGTADPQVDFIRLYRTGDGIILPRLAQEVANPGAIDVDIFDDSDDDLIAQESALRFDHDPPPILADGIIHNNRLFGWGDPNSPDTVWVSNEGEPEYMPLVPFIESEEPVSGGPIEVRAGDGQDLVCVAPWGGMLIAFKSQNAYRISESEVGFYSYQAMPILGCIASDSVQMTTDGLIWFSNGGWMLLDVQEQQSFIGSPVRAISQQITDPNSMRSGIAHGVYVVSFVIAGTRTGLVFSPATGWTGLHDLPFSCYWQDIDGRLYCGRTDIAGITRYYLDVFGLQPDPELQQYPVEIEWYDKARSFGAIGRFKRCRAIRIYGEVLANTSEPQDLTLSVYDEAGTLLSESDFILPMRGIVEIGVGNAAHAEFLQWRISGLVTRPIRINKVVPVLELGADVGGIYSG